MSGATKDGGPAFANGAFQRGMDLRDWFAGQALQIVHHPGGRYGEEGHKKVAEYSYAMADAMIAARGQS